MADPKIRLKRSSVEGKIPTSDQVPLGEIALNTYDGYLYASKNVGIGTTVIAINPFRVGTGTNTYNAYFTAGNVGIGSEIPTTKLDVDGTVTATSFAGSGANLTGLTGASAATYGDSGSTPVIVVDSNGRITGISTVTTSGSGGGGGISNVSEDTTPQLGGDLDLNSSDITGTGNIDITGNVYASGLVGIGTDNPIRTLHIIGNGNPAVLIEDGSGTDQTSTQYKSSATHWSTGIIHGEDAFVINKSDNLTNGTAALYISSTNNVGLSTESPTSKLHVVGDAKISGVVTATSFVGDITGDVTGNADTATTATNVTVSANNSTDETVYPIFVDGATGAQGAESDTGLTYNPSTGTLTATTFSGTKVCFDTKNQLSKIVASVGSTSQFFGDSVAIGTSKFVVGSYGDDLSGNDFGSAYIYDIDGTNEVKITASDGVSNDRFGYSVGIGGTIIVVGAPTSADIGQVYIFNLSGNQLGIITASDGAVSDGYGLSVGVGTSKIVVGAWADDDNGSASGSAYIYDLDGTNQVKITASDGAASDNFGRSVGIGGTIIVVGAYRNDNSGSAYIFDLSGNQLGIITASDGNSYDNFGYSVGVSSDKIVVGAFGDDDNGSSSGSAYIYNHDGTGEVKITASDGAAQDYFGWSVDVSGDRVVVSSRGDDVGSNADQGSAYLFDVSGRELGKFTASDGATNDKFGSSVSIESNQVLIGANSDDVGSNGNQGSAYLFDASGESYIENKTGDLIIESIDTDGGSGANVIINAGTGKTSIVANVNGSVELWNNGSKKLETISTGATVTGDLYATTLYTNGVNVTGVTTSTSFIKSSNSGGFLKADGTEDTSTYLTSYTETDPVVAAINGIVKSDGTTISAATAGTDYLTDISQDTTPQLGGNLDLNSNTINGTGSINITGGASFTGNVTIGGTLTYEDVTNIDSVGLITARSGINATGVVTATSFVKSSNSGGFLKADGTEDTNTYLTSYTETQTLDDVLGLGNTSSTGLSVGVVTTTALKGFDYLQAPHGTTVNYAVTVAAKTAAHRYNGSGSSNGYLIDGVESPFLTFTPGRTYRFTLSSSDMTSHPFRFYLEADKTTAYTTNVTSTATYTEIVVTDTTPTVLHYQCSAHGYMGNAVQVNSNKVNTPYQIDGLNGANITGVVTATSFNGNLTGDVTGTASTATTIEATANTSNTFYRIPFLSDDTGNVSVYTDSGIKYNPSTNELVAATRQVNLVANNSNDETVYLTFADAATGGQELETDTALNYNPSTNTLTAGTFSGSGSSLTGLTGASAATYGSAGATPVIVVDSNGRITGISTVATTGSGGGGGISNVVEDTTPQLGGDLDLNSKNITGTGNANITGVVTATTFSGSGSSLTGLTGASAATYGSSTVTPVITVDANGRITTISTATISGGGGGSSSTRTVNRYVATQSQTLFPASGTISYSVGYLDVYLNGSRLDTTEFTATNGTTVTLGTGASANDVVELVAFTNVNLTDVTVVNDTSPQLGGDLDLNSNNITGTGNINITGTATVSGSQVATQNDAIAFAIALG